jgi:hypothetical protein
MLIHIILMSHKLGVIEWRTGLIIDLINLYK